MNFNDDTSAASNFDLNIQDPNISIKELLEKYLKYWVWFLLSIILVFLVSFYILNFIRPQYKAVASIKIKDEKSGDKSALAAFKDLSILPSSDNNVEDQIEILKSKTLVSEVIKALNLNVSLYTERNKISEYVDNNLNFDTNHYEVENYSNPPLKLNFLVADSLLYRVDKKFKIFINSPLKFTYIDDENSTKKQYTFGQKIKTEFGDVIITPNVDLKSEGLINNDVFVKITSVKELTNAYINSLAIEPKAEYSSILTLTIKNPVLKKAEDFINMLVVKYNQRAVNQKELLTQNTSSLVDKRLEIISDELLNVDLTAENLKTKYRMSDAASDVGFSMQNSQEIDRQLSQANAELQKIEYLKDVVKDENSTDFLTPNISINNDNLASSFRQYDELLQLKKRYLKTSTEKNPIVVNINQQLGELKKNISSGLGNLESSQKISISALQQQGSRINSKLYSAPKQERQIRDVQREQQIKESLYLYLLQKREETAIALGVADPNAEIIDIAEGYGPTSPKRSLFYFASLLIGLFIPFIFIYLRDFLDTRIKSREEVERLLNIPILGDIPKIESKKRFLISKEDHSSIAEAFRILRTNLAFITKDSGDDGAKTIFITSTIAHEGKSLISSNLSTSLALAGKKTLLLGMDIRAPKIKEYLGFRGDKGVTNFLANKNLKIEDLIVEIPEVENLDLISSGDIPPNPAELLLSDRVHELFTQLKTKYDYIIVDTAASSIITDTMIIKDYADAFLYAIRVNYLDKRQLAYLKDVYKNKRYPNLALIVNGVEHKKGYGYGYGYGVNYENSKKKWWQFGKS